jgi:hypothetical protein
LINKEPNKIINQIAPDINRAEENLPRETRSILSQLRTNKSPILYYYLNKINPTTYPSPLCPLCKNKIHDTYHLFTCERVVSSRTVISLWNDPAYVVSLLARWRLMEITLESLAGAPHPGFGCVVESTPTNHDTSE